MKGQPLSIEGAQFARCNNDVRELVRNLDIVPVRVIMHMKKQPSMMQRMAAVRSQAGERKGRALDVQQESRGRSHSSPPPPRYEAEPRAQTYALRRQGNIAARITSFVAR